ncbi:hypothetical protein G4Y73_02655 [Wenzhouxiangella sp. XN201]|uniref:hypothetical protein n=1 Tax=Wenzhouxiangella sp. XN201 TaxID=2710755 RepID=UPI0013C8839A|nr:hypothetical protein [Wenzhouxiangella sp. XN201]NEZ03047.1 hypothetical protein [Wenzhouxiangella sp. XN201]
MKIFRYSIILVTAALLAACGGSSSGGFDDGGSASMSITVESSEVATNSSTSVGVRFRAADGSAVADGTTVTLRSSNTNRGVVSPVGGSSGESATATTSGGQANFTFTARSSTGPVTLTASGANPSGSGTVSTTREIEVIEDPDADARLEISGASSMPANNENVEIFMGSPFINELTVRYNNPDGSAGSVVEGQISVAVSPVSRGAFSTLDDPETDDVNEFFVLMGSAPVNMTAGVATVFVHSFDQPGTLTVSVSAEDAETGDTFSEDFEIEIIEGAADFLPANLDFSMSSDPVYTQGSGGSTSKSVSLFVTDSGGNPVPDPEGSGAEYNNVILSLDAPDGSDARLNGTGASGSVSGSEISVQTVNGVANFSISGATETGPHEITATVDRADNNVDNDLLDPLTATTTVGVGDGRLFSLEIVSPSVSAIIANSVVGSIQTDQEPQIDPETGAVIPPDADGTYSLTITAQGSDQAGNAVLTNTPIDFGKIDAPLTQTLPRTFVFSGGDGNPEEGGNLFSVVDPPEGFGDNPSTVDEAVEPGDTLALFGKSVPGNREHEAARTVASVIDSSTITVTEDFNRNDGSGSIVNDGFVIPWVIGRSRMGVVDSHTSLTTQGRGSVELTYPISAIGRPLVLWGQGNRVEADQSQTVADVEAMVFPGIAPARLSATPSSIQGNSTTNIELCLSDALGAPINDVFIRGDIVEGPANGSLDGQPMPARTELPTGSAGDGCTITEVTTSGMVPEGEESLIRFSVGGATADVQVVPPGSAMLLVSPSRYNDPSPNIVSVTVTLTLLNGEGEPISGVDLTGECEAEGGTLEIESDPGVTDADGVTTARVAVGLTECAAADAEGFPRTGTCTFTTPSGTPVGTFLATGINGTNNAVSPSCPAP